MDAGRFDSLARSLSLPGSRRRALAAALGAPLGMALGAVAGVEAAKKKKKPCPPCKKRKKGKCKANLPDGTACGGGACRSGSCVAAAPPTTAPPVPTCSDGVKNGSETDIDCGGSCPKCGTGKACQVNGDCVNDVCQSQVCQPTCAERPCTPGAAGDATCASFGCGTCRQTAKCGL